jgi:hypothetical protein
VPELFSPGGALWRLFPVVRPEYLANVALLRSCKESPPPLLFFFGGPYSLLHVKTALTVAILQTYDCAVLRWPFEELRPKGRAAPKSPQTTKPIDMDWGGRWAFFVLGAIRAELIEGLSLIFASHSGLGWLNVREL